MWTKDSEGYLFFCQNWNKPAARWSVRPWDAPGNLLSKKTTSKKDIFLWFGCPLLPYDGIEWSEKNPRFLSQFKVLGRYCRLDLTINPYSGPGAGEWLVWSLRIVFFYTRRIFMLPLFLRNLYLSSILCPKLGAEWIGRIHGCSGRLWDRFLWQVYTPSDASCLLSFW